MLKRAFLAGTCLLFSACGNNTSVRGFSVESFIAVDPAEFGVPCTGASDAGEAFASYVVRLVELQQERQNDDEWQTVEKVRGTSPPESCASALLFSQNSNGLGYDWPYVADIWGYPSLDVEADENDPTLVRQDGEPVQPTWVGSCGRLEALPRDAGADAGASAESDFYDRYNGPQYLVSRRTITLRGCTLSPADE